MKARILVVTAVVVCLPVAVWAQTPWNNPSGSADQYDWAGGQNSDTNFFGSPSNFGGDDLYFLDSDFSADADDADTADSATDTMDVDLIAHAGKKFLSISIFEWGDYNITGGAGNNVSADLDLSGTAVGHPMSPFVDDFLFGASGDSAGTIAWNDDATLLLEFAVPDVTSLHITATNTLLAISDGVGGTASVQGNLVLLGISVTLIPEPASLSMLAFGSLVVLRRRRR